MSGLPSSILDNAVRIESLVAPLARACRGRPVFLVDGDRTLTPDDTSRVFLKRAGLDPLVIKERFERDGYCFEAFRFHAEVHVSLGEDVFVRLAPEVASETRLHPGAVDFLRDAARVAEVFVVSAGIPRIWRSILDRHELAGVRVIGGIDPAAPYVFGRAEKAQVARLFRAEAAMVVGVGDSDVDTELLLLAHHAVVVVNHRQNIDLVPHLVDHASVWQVVPQGTPHAGIPVLEFAAVSTLVDQPTKHAALERPCP
jgi:phosphoserine phosphatase